MSETTSWKRTHSCGALRKEHVGQRVTLCGWVANRRDHGQVFFVDLRDRYGITQLVADPEAEGVDDKMLELVGSLGAEAVISASGVVRERLKANPERETGEIEVQIDRVDLLGDPPSPPPIDLHDESETSIEARLKYRYLDLRRKPVHEAILFRSRFALALRSYLDEQGFVEVETPILTKATPEGARDYLVPSRIHKGSFYALPQSPQIFKQLCMVGGLDRYYQMARCFRDEDLRAERQPEFTQLDLEMSFVDEDDVLEVMEGAVRYAFREVVGVELGEFPRIDYAESMERFGLDKPDLRFGMELIDVAEQVRESGFKVFTGALEAGGRVKALCIPGGAEWSRKKIDGLGALAGEYGAKGLAWLKVAEDGLSGPVSKFFPDERGRELVSRCEASVGDLLVFAADKQGIVHRVLGELRNWIAKDLGLCDPKDYRFCWITHFPMFDWSDERQRFEPCHHPFTAPADWDVDLSKDQGSIRSRAYDLVFNGWELGSGSIRIHRQDVQQRVFDALGLSREEAEEKFGFLMSAFRYGAPPHGGFAMGIDRVVARALGLDNIREVIPFPKTTQASDLMTEAPSNVSDEQLEELAIRSTAPAPEAGE